MKYVKVKTTLDNDTYVFLSQIRLFYALNDRQTKVIFTSDHYLIVDMPAAHFAIECQTNAKQF